MKTLAYYIVFIIVFTIVLSVEMNYEPYKTLWNYLQAIMPLSILVHGMYQRQKYSGDLKEILMLDEKSGYAIWLLICCGLGTWLWWDKIYYFLGTVKIIEGCFLCNEENLLIINTIIILSFIISTQVLLISYLISRESIDKEKTSKILKDKILKKKKSNEFIYKCKREINE